MPSIVVFVEGGGESKSQQKDLRLAFDAFLARLKGQLRSVGWHLYFEACGGRSDTYDRFSRWRTNPKNPDLAVLLVDAETAVDVGENTPMAVRAKRHLTNKEPSWNLQQFHHSQIHLMAQVMETWFMGDLDAMEKFYGNGFHRKSLESGVPEQVTKSLLVAKLAAATKDTQRGAYHKGNHSADILGRLNPDLVGKKCPHCKRILDELLLLVQEK